jgi:predicted cobalt transporter CbtA
MIIAALLLTTSQYVIVETPKIPEEAIENHDRTAEASKPHFESVPATSAAKPALVRADEMFTPRQVLEQGRMMSTQAQGLAYRSALAVPVLAGCQVVSTHPAGVFRIADGSMNGRVTFAQCNGFVTCVQVFDLSQPT